MRALAYFMNLSGCLIGEANFGAIHSFDDIVIPRLSVFSRVVFVGVCLMCWYLACC